MRLGFSYPQSQFKIANKTNEGIILTSIDESAVFSFQVILENDINSSAKTVAKELAKVKDSYIEIQKKDKGGNLIISDNKTVDKGNLYSTFRATYNKDRKTMYIYMPDFLVGYINLINRLIYT
jgi:hypothetical protein